MKRISLLLILLCVSVPPAGASYVQVCPDGAACDPAQMVWLQIDPFGATLNPVLTSLVVGGGLLLWGTGCGVGMYLQSLRKMR